MAKRRSRGTAARQAGLPPAAQNTINRVAVPIARSGYGPLALVRHVGRRTGLTYETPLVLARVADGFVAELTYGPNVDWYRNVTAAGRCVVVQHGVEYSVDRIEPCSTADGLAAFGSLRSLALRVLRRREFRRLHVGHARTDAEGSQGP